MPTTVAGVVANITADVSGFQAGLRAGEQATKRFAGEMLRSLGNIKLVDTSKLAKNAELLANGITAGFQANFARSSATLRESLIRGIIDPTQFAAAGDLAARRLNSAILGRMDELREAGKLTEPLRQALVAQLKDVGHEAGAAAADGIGTGITDNSAAIVRAGQGLRNIGIGLSAAITAPLVLGVKSALGEAANAIESDNLFAVSLGRLADEAKGFTEQLGGALNLDPVGLRKTLGTFDAMLKSMGLTEKGAYNVARGVTQLGGDLSSFFNISEDQAFEKLRAGLTGEIQPLRELGIIVSEQTVKQFAYANGIAKAGSTLTEQQKVLARYGSILAQTSLAQGDLARTLDSPVNQMRAFHTQITVLTRTIGTALLPFATPVLAFGRSLATFASDAATGFANLSGPVQSFVVGLGIIAGAAGPVLVALGALVAAYGALTVAAGAAGIALLPIIGIGAAVAVGIAAIIAFRHEIAGFASALFGALRPVLDFVARIFVVGIGAAMGLVVGAFTIAREKVTDVLRALATVVSALLSPVVDFLAAWGRRAVAVVRAAWGVLVTIIEQSPVFQAISGAFTAALSFLSRVAVKFLDAGTALVNALIQGVADAVRKIPSVGPTVAHYVESLLVGGRNEMLAGQAGARVATAYTKSLQSGIKAAANIVVPPLPKVGVDALGAGGTDTSTDKGKTALDLQAEAVARLTESFKALHEVRASTAGTEVAILATYDRLATIVPALLANIENMPAKLAHGAVALGKAFADMDELPIIQFLRHGKGLNVPVSFTPAGGDPVAFFREGFAEFQKTGISYAPFQKLGETVGFEAAASAQRALARAFSNLKIAPAVTVTLNTTGVTGELVRMASGLRTVSEHVREFGRTTLVFAPLGGIFTAIADGLQSMSNGLANVSSTLSSPLRAAGAAARLFGDAVQLSVRGFTTALSGIGRSILSALNPLTIFAGVAQRIASALSPALDALTPSLEALARVVAEGLAPVFQALQPVIQALVPVIRELFSIIGPILVALAPLLRVIVTLLQIVMPIVRLLAIAFTYLGQIVLTVGGALLRLAGNLTIGFGKVVEGIATAIDKLPGVSAKGAINFARDIQKMGSGMLTIADEFAESSKALGQAREQIKNGTYYDTVGASATNASDGLNTVADSARDASEQMRNMPAGFKIAAARWAATAPIAGTPIAAPAGGPTRPLGTPVPVEGGPTATVFTGDLIVVADSEATARKVVADFVGQAESVARTNTGQSRNWADYAPVVARANARARSL